MTAAAKQKSPQKTKRRASQKVRPRRQIRSARVSRGKAAAAAKRAPKPLTRRQF
jgi:hypothetical protein